MKPRQARVALAAVAVIAAAVLVAGPGYETPQVGMYSGAVWLASGRVGEATLVDGVSAEVKAHVPVAGAGAALNVTHQGGAAVVLDEKTGLLSRIDNATEQVSPPVSVLPASDGLVVLPSPDALRAVDVHSGMTTSVDPATLAPEGEPEHLADAVRRDGVVVDGHGRVWAIDDTTGDLVWLHEGRRRTRAAASRNGLLATTRGQLALVSPERGTAELIDPETGAVRRSLRPGLRAGDAVVVSGSAGRSRLLIAIPSRGELVSCTFDTGSCAPPVQVGAAGAELGKPVEVGDHAVVPDHSTGQATIVDLAVSRVVAQRQLFEHPTPFELIARDGIVFYNDPDSAEAGVLDLWGKVRAIVKYTGEPAADEPSPTPDQPVRADEVNKTGHGKQKIGLGLPGRTDRLGLTPPGPEASIVVRPGDRGVTGDVFELSLVFRSATRATTRWSFGDGTGASGAEVRHSWLTQGVFTVRATATLDTGKKVEAETLVRIDLPGEPPQITALSIRRPKPVIGESVHFGADITGTPDQWEWTVTRQGRQVPEVTARTAEFDHRFAAPGHYTVVLTVRKGSQTAQSSRQFTVGWGAVRALGPGPGDRQNVPREAESGVVAIDAGMVHVVALKADGRVIAWGENGEGQLDMPQEANSGVIAISARHNHSLALKADGSVISWGHEGVRELEVPEEARRGVVAIAAGGSHSLALKSDGTVVAWGLGQDEMPAEASSGVVAIGAGDRVSMVLKADGTLLTWGSGSTAESAPPTITGGVRALAPGASVGLALKESGSVISWGWRKEKVYWVPEEAKSDVVAMDLGSQHALAVKADGTAIGWGLVAYDLDPVPPGTSGVLAVAASSSYSFLLLEEID